jgi:histone H3/H4
MIAGEGHYFINDIEERSSWEHADSEAQKLERSRRKLWSTMSATIEIDDFETTEMHNEDSNEAEDDQAQHEHDDTEEETMATAVPDEPSDTSLVVDATTTTITITTTATSRSAVRHPLTGWMIFSQETREQVMRENPGLVFTEVAKLLGEKYRGLSAEEKERLDGLAKADKVRYLREKEEVREYEAIHGKGSGSGDTSVGGSSSAKPLDLVIPVGRVRKIVKLDKDVKNVSKEAMAVITKTTELFVAYMGVRCAGTASLRGARTIRDQDVATTIHSQNAFDFLRLDFPKIPKKPTAKQSSSNSSSSSSSSSTSAVTKRAQDSNHSKPTTGASSIKSFFALTTAAPGQAPPAPAAPTGEQSEGPEADENEHVRTDTTRSQAGTHVEA